jgi:division protein CdvB (Snf7/Vps24/ESCRT-III family)
MAEITNELMYEVMKAIQSDVAALKEGQREHNAALNAIRIHMVAMHQDIQNIYATLTRHETRLDRIERRLEIAEVT